MKKILEVRGDDAIDILGLLKAVATAEGALELHEIHRLTLEAMAHHLFACEVDCDTLEGAIAGAGERITDPELRREVMNMAGIFPFLEPESMEPRVDVFERLGEAFELGRKYARELRHLCHEAVSELTICMLRPIALETGKTLVDLSLTFAEGPLHLDGDAEVLARYERYRELDDGIFGKVLTDYYRDNTFPLPGTPHAPMSNGLKVHDIHHVLEGYPTTPLGETCILAFDAAVMDLDLGKTLVAYVAQFQVGLQFDKTLPLWRNQFKPDIVMRAYERGGACNTDFLKLDFDWTELLEQPLAEVRERFGIPVDGALMREPGDLWCGDMGLVGQRDSPDMVTRKMTWLQKITAKLNVSGS